MSTKITTQQISDYPSTTDTRYQQLGKGVYFVSTKAAGNALASTLSDTAVVLVQNDESWTPAGVKVRYTVTGGTLGGGVADTSAQIQYTPASPAGAAVTTDKAALDALRGASVYNVATKAAGNTLAATLPNGATVIVWADESWTPAGVKVMYTVTAGVTPT